MPEDEEISAVLGAGGPSYQKKTDMEMKKGIPSENTPPIYQAPPPNMKVTGQAPPRYATPEPENRFKVPEQTETVQEKFSSIPQEGKSYQGYTAKPEGGLGGVQKKYEVSQMDTIAKSITGRSIPLEEKAKADKAAGKPSYVEDQLNPLKSAQDLYGAATKVPGGIVEGAIAAKGYVSETKLKLEASKYGITPHQFEELKKQDERIIEEKIPTTDPKTGKVTGYRTAYKKVSGLQAVKAAIDQGKSREAALINARSIGEKTKAEAAHERATAYASRVAAEAKDVSLPSGGARLVGFGHAEGTFGQGQPNYLNAKGSHGAVRSKFIPQTGTGVAASVAHSRLAMARLRESVVPRGEREMGIPEGLLPSSQLKGVSTIARLGVSPSSTGGTISRLGSTPVSVGGTVSRLGAAPASTGGTISRLSATPNVPRPGPSVISRLGFKKQ